MSAFDVQEGLAFCEKYNLPSGAESELISLLERAMGASDVPPALFPVASTKAAITDFDEFYKAYPKKRKPGDARKAWQQTAKKRPPIEYILLAIEDQKQSEDWLKDGGQFIPLPATWLRSEEWANEVEIDRPADGPTPQERLKALQEQRKREREAARGESVGDGLVRTFERSMK